MADASIGNIPASLSGQAGLLSELLTHAITPALNEAGISVAMFELLSAVHAAGSGVSQATIARRLGITPPSFTEALRSACNNGLVTQIPHPKDGRSRSIKITPKGRRALNSVLEAVNLVEADLVEGISLDELETAVGVLKRANRNLALRIHRT